jgi:signal transduction histidine kinase
MLRRHGLKARFIGLITLLLTAMFSIIAVILINTNVGSLRSDLLDRSKAFAALATTPIGNTFVTYQDSGTYLIKKQISSFQNLDPAVSAVSVVGLDGSVLYSTKTATPAVTPDAASSFNPIYMYTGSTISRIVYPFIDSNGSHSYAVVYDISSATINQAVGHLIRSILLYSLMGLLVSAVIMYFFVDYFFLRPVKRLRDSAILIASGHYSETISVERDDELGDLAASTHQMAESLRADILKLQESDRIKSEFMMIAAHNLRTPLTIIKGYLSLTEALRPSPEMSEILSNILTGTERLEHFAEDIITISSIESGQRLFSPQKFALTPLLKGLADEFEALARDKKITLTTHLPSETITLDGSPIHLRSALGNLLENAYKFTSEGGAITLGCTLDGDKVRISVTDNGIGIAPEEIAKLFTKFHRGTDTLRYDYEGAGIGLYVTKLIITEHRGTITADSTEGQGSTFTVTLPVVTESPQTATGTYQTAAAASSSSSAGLTG